MENIVISIISPHRFSLLLNVFMVRKTMYEHRGQEGLTVTYILYELLSEWSENIEEMGWEEVLRQRKIRRIRKSIRNKIGHEKQYGKRFFFFFGTKCLFRCERIRFCFVLVFFLQVFSKALGSAFLLLSVYGFFFNFFFFLLGWLLSFFVASCNAFWLFATSKNWKKFIVAEGAKQTKRNDVRKKNERKHWKRKIAKE